MRILNDALFALSGMHLRHYKAILILAFFSTLLVGLGISNVHMQTDIKKEMPQDLPIFRLQDKVSARFGESDLLLIVVELDPSSGIRSAPSDIRDPRVLVFLKELESMLMEESPVDRVSSAASFMPSMPASLESSKLLIGGIPPAQGFFNKDYTSTLIYVSSTIGTDENKVVSLIKAVEEDISSAEKPPGIKVTVTGEPPIRNLIFGLLWQDAVKTISIASIAIFLLLIIMQASVERAALVFIPLSLGLLWTLGIMGWLDMPLSVATVGIGAMVLGLGVEYGIFVVSRYYEEKERHSSEKALRTAVTEIGSAIFGSGTTTMVGFGALAFASMPMLQKLGLSLALGIALCLAAALFVNPSFIILIEKRLGDWKK